MLSPLSTDTVTTCNAITAEFGHVEEAVTECFLYFVSDFPRICGGRINVDTKVGARERERGVGERRERGQRGRN